MQGKKEGKKSVTAVCALTSLTHGANMRRVGHTKECCSKSKGPHREVTSAAASMITSCNYLSICVFVGAAEAPTAQSPSPSFSPWSGCGPPRSPFKDQCWSPSANIFLLFSPFAIFFSSEDMLHSLSAEQMRVMTKKRGGANTLANSAGYAHFHFSIKHLHYNQCFVFPCAAGVLSENDDE